MPQKKTTRPAAPAKRTKRTPGTAPKPASRKKTPAAPARKPRKAAAPAAKKASAQPVPAPRKAPASKPKARTRTSRAPKPGAMEALYSGKVFRSRLEARWAILMDLLEINWDYEPSHYQVGPHLWYLPDFYLPEHETWLEVKGAAFMDAGSMAKVLASVAGPMPVPLREAPYTASRRLMLGGPLVRTTAGRPVHTLVTRSLAGKADLTYATFGREGAVPAGEPWDSVEATGIPKARRPSAPRLKALLEPEPIALMPPADVAAAYRFAATAAFDDATRTLAASNDYVISSRLAARRSGRPLGVPGTAVRLRNA